MKQICKNIQTVKKHVDRKTGSRFNAKGLYFLLLIVLLTVVWQSFILAAQAKTWQRTKKPLQLLQHPSSLIKLRHKRDTFANEEQDEAGVNYDDNYDIVPDESADNFSERAQQVAEGFKRMWQSIKESVHHCIGALRAMFGEPLGDEDLTPEQEQVIMTDLEAKYRLKHQQDNEI